MSRKMRVMRAVRHKLSELKEEHQLKLKESISDAFHEMQFEKRNMVMAQRAAVTAAAQLQAKQAKVVELMMGALEKAVEAFDDIGTEPVWDIYEKDGDIIFEALFTERDVRNAQRMGRLQFNREVDKASEDGGGDDINDLFEKPEDES